MLKLSKICSPWQNDLILLLHLAVRVERLERAIVWRMPEPVCAEVERALLVGHEGGGGEEALFVGVAEDVAEGGDARAVQAEHDLLTVEVDQTACEEKISIDFNFGFNFKLSRLGTFGT